MKLNYLYIDHHNGHETTYHPFTSNTLLTQERVLEWMRNVVGASQCGSNLSDLLCRLEKENIPFEEFWCHCCEQPVYTIKKYLKKWELYGIKWILIEGITGNY